MNDDDEQVTDDLEEWDDVDDDGEVLTPDEVSSPRTIRRASGGKAPMPDRFGRYSMYAGVGSILLLVLFPVLIFVLFLACAAIFLGLRTRKQLADAEDPERARKRAKIGTIAGGLTIGLLLVLVVYFNFIYSSPDKVHQFNEDKTTEPG